MVPAAPLLPATDPLKAAVTQPAVPAEVDEVVDEGVVLDVVVLEVVGAGRLVDVVDDVDDEEQAASAHPPTMTRISTKPDRRLTSALLPSRGTRGAVAGGYPPSRPVPWDAHRPRWTPTGDRTMLRRRSPPGGWSRGSSGIRQPIRRDWHSRPRRCPRRRPPR